jgi:hypothetical protein
MSEGQSFVTPSIPTWLKGRVEWFKKVEEVERLKGKENFVYFANHINLINEIPFRITIQLHRKHLSPVWSNARLR